MAVQPNQTELFAKRTKKTCKKDYFFKDKRSSESKGEQERQKIKRKLDFSDIKSLKTGFNLKDFREWHSNRHIECK